MKHYYNEFDPKAAEWLRELIKEGHLPDGDVDERDIQDVRPEELMGYTQCHFFAGIGGWPLALRIAGIPTTTKLWTGSCPCQPFSAAGKGAGADDERHLWPAWQWLISQCQPDIIFGEQVASKAGREWFATVQTDLQNMGYAASAADICAAGVGAPHWRQRLWFVGIQHTPGDGWEERWTEPSRRSVASGCSEGGLADGDDTGSQGRGLSTERATERPVGPDSMAGIEPFASTINGFWGNADWILCTDGKWRPVEPGTFPLAHGVSDRVGLLRGYGNAIVPQVAATFIEAVME